MATTDEILDTFGRIGTVKGTSKLLQISYQTVRRVLVTNGIVVGKQTEAVQDLLVSGYSPEKIASMLGITVKTVKAYMAYTKGSYATSEPTANAKRIRAFREHKLKEEAVDQNN